MNKPGRQPERSPSPPTHWGEAAEWYDQLVGDAGSEFHQKIILPGVLRLLSLRSGQRALDVACGQGVLCRALYERGVGATGVDASSELIHKARRHNAVLPARDWALPAYHVADARELGFLPAASFEAAACVLGIQNIQPIAPVFAGVARTLVSMGRFVIVMMHPCFRGPKYTSWGWDEAAKVQYRRVDRYLTPRKEPIVTHPGKDASRYTWTFHRPLASYFKAARAAGLVVDTLEEWASHKTSAPGPRAAAENTARREIPMFMAMRAVKYPHADPLPGGEGSKSGSNE